MSDTHAARPPDLVALVTFAGEVRGDQAGRRQPAAPAPAPASWGGHMRMATSAIPP